MLFSIEGGLILTPNDKDHIVNELCSIIINSKDARVRQWCYMLGSFMISEKLSNLCILKLEGEVQKNQTWILALLSNNLRKEEFSSVRKRAENYLSKDVINLSTYLFSDYQVDPTNPNYVRELIRKGDDELALLWVGWIATFWNQNLRSKRIILVDENSMSELTGFKDDNILKHIMAAFSRRNNFKVERVQFDVFDYKGMESEHKKWTMTAIFKDRNFISEYKDYIITLLSKQHLFHLCDKREREGLASGLSTYKYDPDFVYNVLDWYSSEPEESVKQYLLEYMLSCQDKCDDYLEMVYSASMNGTNAEKMLINSKKKILKRPDRQKAIVLMPPSQIIINNNKGDVIMGDVNKAKQVGNMGTHAGEKSKISMIYHESGQELQIDYIALVNEIIQLKAHYQAEPDSPQNQIAIGKLAEAQVAAEGSEKDGVISAMKALGKEIYDIAKKIGCSLVAALIKEAMMAP